MASRPEAAYAAAEVTPKWVLISWHHLPSPLLIIPVSPRTHNLPTGWPSVETARNEQSPRHSVARHDHRVERKHLATARIDVDPHPMDVGTAKRLDAGEIRNQQCLVDQRLINLEEVRIA